MRHTPLHIENKMTNDSFITNYDDTLTAQYEYSTQILRSHMYEFALLFIISAFVLVITIKNMTSDSATTAGQVICWIILIWFVVAVVIYLARWIDGMKLPALESGSGSGSGPIIRIHYV